jgi:hypothetical protein
VGANTVAGEQDSEHPGPIRKAVNLSTFLGRAQKLRVKLVRTVDKSDKVVWFGDLSEHPTVRLDCNLTELEVDVLLLAVDGMPRIDPPSVPEHLTARLTDQSATSTGSLDFAKRPTSTSRSCMKKTMGVSTEQSINGRSPAKWTDWQ